MSDLPEIILIYVYEDFIPFVSETVKQLRVSDHTPPPDIDCELSKWIRQDLHQKSLDEVTALKAVLGDLRDAIAQSPKLTFGAVTDSPDQQGWFIRDELVDKANKVLRG